MRRVTQCPGPPPIARARRRCPPCPSSSRATVAGRAPCVVEQPPRHRQHEQARQDDEEPDLACRSAQLARVDLRGGRRPHGRRDRRGGDRLLGPVARRERDRGAARAARPSRPPRHSRPGRAAAGVGVGVAAAAAIVVAAGVGDGAAPCRAPASGGRRVRRRGGDRADTSATAPPAAAWLSRLGPATSRRTCSRFILKRTRRVGVAPNVRKADAQPPPSSERPVISSGWSMPEQRQRGRRDVGEDALPVERVRARA